MKRKQFLSAVLPAAALLQPALIMAAQKKTGEETKSIIPAYLKKGDVIVQLNHELESAQVEQAMRHDGGGPAWLGQQLLFRHRVARLEA